MCICATVSNLPTLKYLLMLKSIVIVFTKGRLHPSGNISLWDVPLLCRSFCSSWNSLLTQSIEHELNITALTESVVFQLTQGVHAHINLRVSVNLYSNVIVSIVHGSGLLNSLTKADNYLNNVSYSFEQHKTTKHLPVLIRPDTA